MNKAIISDGQSLMDVAIQESGSVEALFDLADANGLAITDALAPGQVLAVPASAAVKVAIVNYLASKFLRINTGSDTVLLPPRPRPRDFKLKDFKPTDFS